jgi:putative PIG3 family NAD(P)H quinone oxidoreductase
MTDLPRSMRQVAMSKPGGADVLHLVEAPLPQPGPGELLIRVAAAGINRPDVFQRMGAYPPPPGASPVLGLEVAGIVAAVGSGVTTYRIGDAVCALTPGGGYAEFCLCPAAHALPVPPRLSMTEAAALPETLFTVWGNVFMRGRLQAGEDFLVHGGASGIGTTAIQLAKGLGARVFTTAKGQACRQLGADVAIDYATADFVAVVREQTGDRGVDVILDMVGGDYIARDIDALAVDGRLVFIAFLRGSRAQIDFLPVQRKRLTLTGSTLRPQSNEAKAAIATAVHDQVWPLIEAGRFTPVIDRVFPLEQVADAHRRMESGEHIGKIVLRLD